MAAGDPGTPKRNYSAIAIESSILYSIPAQSTGASYTSFIVASNSGWPTVPFTLIIDPDTSKEEVVTATALSGAATYTITRGENSTASVAHSAGAVVRHGVSGREFTEQQAHIAARGFDVDSAILSNANQTHLHGLQTGDGSVVGSDQSVTLTRKTLTTPTINGATLTGTVTSTANINMTGGTITGLSSSGMSTTSATPKNYVDAILGSATAASTSATSAATSATSAAASATVAATSATSAATSASSSLTSQTAAAASQTAAATSATSAAASATAAATSATSAAASATSAANSVSTIATYATNASNSATAAATSATSAAASATSAGGSATTASASASTATTQAAAAAASATSAAASATAAATSATSAAASATTASNSAATATTQATAAATSATSAAASATAAATSATSAATSATSSATSFTSIDQKYLGAKASAPSFNNQGGALATGALYWNTSNNTMYVYNGSSWAASTANANITMYRYTASGGETSKSGADDNSATLAYAVGFEQVYVNGVLLVRGLDYTASTGSSITGLTPLVANDILVVLAFTAFSVANAVPLSTYTAKGDVAVGTGASTVGTLSVGADGTTLVANSASATGVAWTAGNPIPNPVLNSAMQIWQRGTSFAGGTGYTANTADRWNSFRGGFAAGSTVSRQSTNDTTNLPFIQYCARVGRDSGNTSTAVITYNQTFESINSIPFSGKTVTMSFYARKGADYSSATSGLQCILVSGTGTDQNVQSGFTGTSNVINNSPTLTTTWQRFTFTGTVSSTSTQLGIIFQFTPVGTAGANDYFEITGVQIDIGSVALPFRTYAGTLQGELAACQRYYYRQTVSTVYGQYGVAWLSSATGPVALITFPVTMRVAPTALESSNLSFRDYANTHFAASSVTLDTPTTTTIGALYATISGGTAGRVGVFEANNTTSSYLGWTAEL